MLWYDGYNVSFMRRCNINDTVFLSLSKKPFLDLLWAKVRNKQALIMTLEGHTYTVDSIAISSDNSKIVSGSEDKTIKVWDLNTGRLLNTLEGFSSRINSVAITSDNSKIISGSGGSLSF